MHTLLLVHLLVQPCANKMNSMKSLLGVAMSEGDCGIQGTHMWCGSSVKGIISEIILKSE